YFLLFHPLPLNLTPRNNEMVVLTVTAPWTGRDIGRIHESPIGQVSRLKAKIIAHSRRDIEAGAAVQIRFWPLVLENVLVIIGSERSAILPLRETSAVPLANGKPVMLTNGLPRTRVSLLEPRDDERRFRLELAVAHIVIRE